MSIEFHASSLVRSEPTTSATRKSYEVMRDQILTCRLAPGEKLKVDSLKKLLATGASPIREALSLLTSDQLVVRVDQRGFRVAPVSAEQFNEILRLRCSLEDMALRESLSHADRNWEEALVLAHHRLSRTPRKDVAEYETLHKSFHMVLLSQCRSPILRRFCDHLYDLNIRYRYLAGRSGAYARRDVAKEHADILSAAVRRDIDQTSTRLIEHYQQTGKFLAGQLVDL